jgi:hypothetical protein
MSFEFESAVLGLGLFLGLLCTLEWGRRAGRRMRAKLAEGASAGIGAVEAAVFALLGLMIAFTFQGAATRFDQRRELIVQEANAIGTAWLRLDLLPKALQPQAKDLFRKYLDSRLESYRKIPDMVAVRAELARTAQLQDEIWKLALAAQQAESGPVIVTGLMPALNNMFDIVTTRSAATDMHPPMVVFAMLVFLALTAGFFAGHGMSGSNVRSWMHIMGFSAVLAITVCVIMDLEYPRLGMIRVDSFDRILVELRQSMEPAVPVRPGSGS